MKLSFVGVLNYDRLSVFWVLGYVARLKIMRARVYMDARYAFYPCSKLQPSLPFLIKPNSEIGNGDQWDSKADLTFLRSGEFSRESSSKTHSFVIPHT